MGADKFMHISFPRHLSYELLSRRRNIMAEAAKDLGMEFIDVWLQDPVSDVGVAGAQQYILEQVPNWLINIVKCFYYLQQMMLIQNHY